MIIAAIFYNLLSAGMLSLRLMNVLFSCASLYIIWKLLNKIGIKDSVSTLAILGIATNPIYFLNSISVQAVNMFCFFLVTATYLFYCKKYLLSVIATSLLPLIRPEGYLSLFILPIFLLKENRQNIKYAILLFLPLIVWGLANVLLLGDGLLSRLFYQSLLASHNVFGKFPLGQTLSMRPTFTITPLEFLLSSGYPVFLLFLIGFGIKLFDKRYSFISVSFLAYFFFYSAMTIVVNLGFEKINVHGIMALVSTPIVPFLVLFAVIPATILERCKSTGRFVVVLFTAIFILSNLIQITAFRQDPALRWRAIFNLKEENVLKDTAKWLGEYAKENDTERLYISVDEATHKFTNIFLIYLPPGIKFYMLSVEDKNISLIDLETIKVLPFRREGSVYLSRNKGLTDLGGQIKCKLIKGFGDISLYFYALEKAGDIQPGI